jgi:transcription elongation GreA/GreB family factor
VQTLTPATPLGRLLMGQRVGDGVRARLPRGVRELEIVAVA